MRKKDSNESLQILTEMMQEKETRVMYLYEIKELPPVNNWARYEYGKTLYVVLAIGPGDLHVENNIRLALGHPAESLQKEKS